MANTTTGVTRIIKAAGYSWKGLCAAWRYEAAFRQECILVLSALIISFGWMLTLLLEYYSLVRQ